MLKVVSVSLGASSRDKQIVHTLLGQSVQLSRIGTDGSLVRAAARIAELDNQVDAIGLGGIDLYLCAGERKYMVRDAKRLANAAKHTPVVDGSGLKLTLERTHIEYLAHSFTGPALSNSKVLMVSAVDRWGMAQGLASYTTNILYGDLIFALGLPIPLRRLSAVSALARMLLPVLTRLPFKVLYPTGKKQKEHKPRHSEYFLWADWICGDFHYIRRNLPPRLDGKVILTNTTTEEDAALLTQRGLSYLITTTPIIDGRSFGMNVLEGCIVALIRQRGDLVSESNYEVYLNKLSLNPTIMQLN